MTGVSVVQDWLLQLPLQQQAVLLLACRGCDSVPKEHPSKPIVRMVRAFVLNAARVGRKLSPGERGGDFMYRPSDAYDIDCAWEELAPHVEALPMHYVTHLMHAIEILGYAYPEEREASRWRYVYTRMANAMHVNPETSKQMNARLDDWGRKAWDQATPSTQTGEAGG